MNTQDTNRKLPMRVKLGYSVASVAPTIQMLIQMYFLLYFYVSIVGLSGGVADRKSLGLYQRSADGIAGRKVEQTRWNLFVVDEAGPDSNRNFYGTMFFRAESVLYHESSLGGSNLYLPRHVADRLFDTNECPAAEADNRQNRKSKTWHIRRSC